MKIGVIIPDRGDRPLFLKNCLRLLTLQTIQPHVIALIDYAPINNACDITPRYRSGYDFLSKCGVDVIFLIENDDYYAPNYIETMLNAWIERDKPDIFGTDYTIYYNIRIWGQMLMEHLQRSSAMSTLIKPNLSINWPLDHDPYTDVALYNQLKYGVFRPKTHICLGIKHGVGACGGNSHTNGLNRYHANMDRDKSWIKSQVDEDSFKLYQSILTEQNQPSQTL